MGLTGENNDAGVVASAIEHLHDYLQPEKIGQISGAKFYVDSLTSPTGVIRNGQLQRLDFPKTEIYKWKGYRIPRHDLLIVSGNEPPINWDGYTELLATLSEDLAVRQMMGIGAYYHATASHTRDVRLYTVFN